MTSTQAIRRVTSLFALLFSFGILSACSDDAASEVGEGQPVGADRALLELNGETPGFGGLFYDERGALNVYVQRGQLATLSEGELESTFADYLARPLRGSLDAQGLGQGSEARRDLEVLAGDYTFRDLLAWRAQVDSLGVEGVVLTDADERLNRVRVGVTDEAAKTNLKARLAEQNTPADAVVIEEVTPYAVTKSLRSKVRPLVGGLEIEYSDSVCTLGFNAKRKGQKGFVTNSHCTDEAGGTEGTRYAQGGGHVGVERADPEYRESKNCPAGRRCRTSDSAFVAAPNVKRNTDALARTVKRSVTLEGKLDIMGQEKSTVAGEKLDKVGRSTGWTLGEAEETCVSVDVYDENGDTGRTLLCQDIVSADMDYGDSGAPVFRYAGGGEVYMRGVLWGGADGTYVFSPAEQIRRELKLDREAGK